MVVRCPRRDGGWANSEGEVVLYRYPPRSPERNETQDFGFALQALDKHRGSPHAVNAAPAKPVVTYKKRHRLPPDVVPSRVQ